MVPPPIEHEMEAPLKIVGTQLSAVNAALVHPLNPDLEAIFSRMVTSEEDEKSKTFPRYLSYMPA